MIKIRTFFIILAFAVFGIIASNVLPAFAQQSFVALANIFTGATQTITSNADHNEQRIGNPDPCAGWWQSYKSSGS